MSIYAAAAYLTCSQ